MAYNPVTDFVGLWRLAAGQVSKLEMPGLDFVLAAFARSGLITLSVSATPPLANQSTTAWLQAAVPSNTAEGTLRLWDPVGAAYVPATAALFLKMLEAAAGENGVSWWTTAGGPPANVVGNNGDFAIRTDEPGGVYGPKAAGVWPALALPGTTNILTNTQLDNTFGNTPGSLISRGAALWAALPPGPEDSFFAVIGGFPAWTALTALLDILFSGVQGSILQRGAVNWQSLPPGAAGQVLSSGGAGVNNAWAPRTAEFPSTTRMLFHQTAAPVGWTKQVALNDYGLRVTSGAVTTVPGNAFSAVFAQTVVGNTTLGLTQIPPHDHDYQLGVLNNVFAGGGFGALGNNTPSTTGLRGGGLSHAHSINLTLSYTDVIIAQKD